jgi:hypothetical protein
MITGTTSTPPVMSLADTVVPCNYTAMDLLRFVLIKALANQGTASSVVPCLQPTVLLSWHDSFRRSSTSHGMAAVRRRHTRPPTSSGRTTAQRPSTNCGQPSTSTPRTTCCPFAVRVLCCRSQACATVYDERFRAVVPCYVADLLQSPAPCMVLSLTCARLAIKQATRRCGSCRARARAAACSSSATTSASSSRPCARVSRPVDLICTFLGDLICTFFFATYMVHLHGALHTSVCLCFTATAEMLSLNEPLCALPEVRPCAACRRRDGAAAEAAAAVLGAHRGVPRHPAHQVPGPAPHQAPKRRQGDHWTRCCIGPASVYMCTWSSTLCLRPRMDTDAGRKLASELASICSHIVTIRNVPSPRPTHCNQVRRCGSW